MSYDTRSAGARQLSVIGPSLSFKGQLAADEDLLIEGRVEGSINHRGTNLTIGVHGEVKADIVAENVIVQGKVEGDVRAKVSVIVEPSAQLHGDIYAPSIGLKEGAKFRGTIDMDVPRGSASAKPNGASARTPRENQIDVAGETRVDAMLSRAHS